MPAGPAALLVALCLLPGWIYWRLEGRPRTARTPLGELFEVVGAGAVASGLTVLGYLTLRPFAWRALIDPAELSRSYLEEHLVQASWTVAGLVAFACLLAGLAGRVQRRLRDRRSGGQSTYLPEVPLWVSVLGGQPEKVVTVDLRAGGRISGYLQGYDVAIDATPSIYLAPPIRRESPSSRRGWSRRSEVPTVEEFSFSYVTIPGAEVLAVWTAAGE